MMARHPPKVGRASEGSTRLHEVKADQCDDGHDEAITGCHYFVTV
jgi:hypothetical protein